MKKFDASVPRKMFWSMKVGGKDFCPQCKSKLENESHTYLLCIRKPGDFQTFIVGNDDGYFCRNFPVVVLDYEAFAESAIVGCSGSKKFRFTVPGIVDLDAVPEEKSDIPFGEDDNPVPLVKFTNLEEKDSEKKKLIRGNLKELQRKRKRKRRLRKSQRRR